MSIYALDTNIVSYFIRKNEAITRKVNAELKGGSPIVIPPIVYYEVRRGLLSINAPVQEAVFEELCASSSVGTLDREGVETAAAIYSKMRKTGHMGEDMDILIAAYCVRNDFTLVTNNTKHFETVDNLKYTNWL